MNGLNENGTRLICFAAVLLTMAIWEVVAPRRKLTASKGNRWCSHLLLNILNTLAVRLVVPLGATGIAIIAQNHDWGILNRVSIAPWLAILVGVVALDLVMYVQHVMFHYVPLLWRLHKVHHADPDFDVTTGLRFHTLEILLSMVIKGAAVVALGAPPIAVLVFEILLNGTTLFNHANAKLPRWLERVLRLIVVTPDMHRIHHSVRREETNSNFGFNLPWWDYLFRSYRPEPADGQQGMTIGLSDVAPARAVHLVSLLVLPFASAAVRDKRTMVRDQDKSPLTPSPR